jgi:hypothetical protein
LLEGRGGTAIAVDVLAEFPRPEFDVALGQIRVLAVGVTVPETTVYDNNGSISRQNDIGPAWQSGYVKPEAATHPVQNGPDLSLCGGIPATDARHVPTSTFRRQSVGHRRTDHICCKQRKTAVIPLSMSERVVSSHWWHCSVKEEVTLFVGT